MGSSHRAARQTFTAPRRYWRYGLEADQGRLLFPRVPPAVDDGIATIQPERLFRQARARRRLEALVFRDVEQVLHLLGVSLLETCRHAIRDRAVLIHEDFKDTVQDRVIGQ